MGKGDTTGPSTRADSTSSVTQAQLTARLDAFGSNLTTKLNLAVAEAVSSSLESLKCSLEITQKEFSDYVQFSKETFALLSARIKQLETARVFQQVWNNTREQRNRNKTCRIHNYRCQVSSAAESMMNTYEFIVKPAFLRANAAGEIDHVPSMAQCTEFGHSLAARSPTDIPSILYKFSSRYYFQIFLRHGRLLLQDWNKTRGQAEQVRLGRDLTFVNRRVMTLIAKHNLTDKVRLSGTTIQFTMKADPTVWKNVHNPMGDCLADFGTKLLDPFQAKMKEAAVEAPVVMDVDAGGPTEVISPPV